MLPIGSTSVKTVASQIIIGIQTNSQQVLWLLLLWVNEECGWKDKNPHLHNQRINHYTMKSQRSWTHFRHLNYFYCAVNGLKIPDHVAVYKCVESKTRTAGLELVKPELQCSQDYILEHTYYNHIVDYESRIWIRIIYDPTRLSRYP